MRKISLLLLLTPALLATSCPPRVKVAPAPSRPHAPAFRFDLAGLPLKTVRSFAVAPCLPDPLRQPLWRIRRADVPKEDNPPASAFVTYQGERIRSENPAGEPIRVTYGEVPEGYVQVAAPRPLAPGRCYLADVIGPAAGQKEFHLLPDGRARMGPGRGPSFLRSRTELNRAAVHCRNRYRRAPLLGDTAAIDALVYPVADTSVTCGWLRTRQAEYMASAMSRERNVAVFTVIGLLTAALAINSIHQQEK